jgi:TRAP-type mannitol/chloroaromatic compound transport system permease small subunit
MWCTKHYSVLVVIIDSFVIAKLVAKKKLDLKLFHVYISTNRTIEILSNIFFFTPFCIVSKWNRLESILTKVLLDQKT